MLMPLKRFTSLLVFLQLLLYKIALSQCGLHLECDECIIYPDCGWCELLKVCVEGNATGPIDGSCEYNYNSCNTPSPIDYQINWYQYGGNAQHTGYVNYQTHINYKTIINKTYENLMVNESLGISLISSYQNYIYYWSSGKNILDESFVFCQDFELNKIVWSTNIGSNIIYCSQPSLMQDNSYLILICYKNNSYLDYYLNIFILNANTGDIIPNEFEQKLDLNSYNNNTLSSIYSPLIADNLNMFMINYNVYTLGLYQINPFKEIWIKNMSHLMQQTVSSYDPKSKYFYSFQSGLSSDSYSYLAISNIDGVIKTFQIYPNGYDIPVIMALQYNMTIIGNNLYVGLYNDSIYPPTLETKWQSGSNTNGISIDEIEGNIYAYMTDTKQVIQSRNIFNGDVVGKYGTVYKSCDWNYGILGFDGCLVNQPLITKHNIFWPNVRVYPNPYRSVLAMDKNNQGQTGIDVCMNSGMIGVYLSWTNDKLIVNCGDSIEAYKFTNN